MYRSHSTYEHQADSLSDVYHRLQRHRLGRLAIQAIAFIILAGIATWFIAICNSGEM